MQELDIYATQQATSSPQPNCSPRHACHNTTAPQQPANSSTSLCKPPPQAAQHQQQPPADKNPSHSFEYDLPTQEQGGQHDGGNEQQQSLGPLQQGVKQAGASEQTLARSGVRLVDQHATPTCMPDSRQHCNALPQEGRHRMTIGAQQQQQQLVPLGALGDADAVEGRPQGAVGQTGGAGSDGVLHSLWKLHQQPPWGGLTVTDLCQAS